MPQLLDNNLLTEELAKADGLLIMCDFDGTLVPLPRDHDRHTLTTESRQLIEQLQKLPRTHLAIISGRSMEDLRWRCAMPGLSIGSDHGLRLEVAGNHSLWLADIWKIRNDLDSVRRPLLKKLHLPKHGMVMENKPFSLALYFRDYIQEQMEEATHHFTQIISTHHAQDEFHLLKGHSMLEYRPKHPNKGVAVQHLVDSYAAELKNPLAIYIGDDTTDEDGFHALKDNGISIRVGKDVVTTAKYSLANQADVLSWLKSLYQLKNKY